MNSRRLADNPVAIVGVSGLFPRAGDHREFWQNIVDARDCVEEVPASRWNLADFHDPDPAVPDRAYSRRGGFVPDVAFDPLEFGLPPNQLEVTSSLQTLSLVVARDLLKDAGATGSDWYDPTRTGVILGVTGPVPLTHSLAARLSTPVLRQVVRSCGLSDADAELIAEKYLQAFAPWEENTFPGLLANVTAGRIANRLGLGGMTSTVDAACASSMSALRMAVAELLDGRADLMITGGCDTENSVFMYLCFSKTQALSRTDQIRPFDSTADGTLIGEGIGMLALKRLADAERDGDRVYAVIRGIGSSSDGRAKSIYAPLADGQRVALRRAYEDADCSPVSVGLFEAHATGTPVGDATELSALTDVLRDASAATKSAAVGSVKSQIGHLKGAAGAASLIKLALSLHQKTLPPTINVKRPHAVLADSEAKLYVNTQTRPWIRDPHRPLRRAAASAMGFGGVNFHVVLEEHDPGRDGLRVLHRTTRAYLWHAPDVATLVDRVRCEPPTDEAVPAQSARIGFVAADDETAERLRTLAVEQLVANAEAGEWSHPAGVHFRRQAMADLKIGALFAGQGGQYLDMGLDAALNNPVVGGAFDDANTGSLADVVFPPPVFDADERKRQEAVLTRTENAQPAIGALCVGQFRYLRELGLDCSAAMGHSFGELTALWAAGSIGDTEFFRLAHARGAAAAASPNTDPGAMAAVKASRADVDRMLADLPDVTICNHNGPEQIVVGGGTDAITVFLARCEELGLTTRKLSISGAFHTRYVTHAVDSFHETVAECSVGEPRIPVYANSPGAHYGADPRANERTLAEQMAKPVEFAAGLQAMRADGCTVFVEFGPKQVLTYLVKDNLPDVVAIPADAGPFGDSDAALKQAAVRLAVLGAPITGINRYAADAPAPHPVAASAVPMNGAEYVPDSRRAAFQAALSDGRRIAVDPVAAPVPVAAGDDVAGQHLALHSRYLEGQLSIAEGLAKALGSGASAEVLRAAEQAKQQSIDISRTHIRANEILSSLAGLEKGVPEPVLVPPVPHIPESVAEPVPEAVGEAVISDAESVIVEVVAERTGYPASMLDSTMDLEADLGVDSIKRVQILGVIRERFPEVPVLGPERLADLRTIADIAALVRGPAESKPVVEPVPDAVSVLVNVVAERTGYPASMLDPAMDLEADLGVDSIKRVQILGVVRERFPEVPVLGPERLADLRTIADIAALLRGPVEPAVQESVSEPVRLPVRLADLPPVDRLDCPFRTNPVAWLAGTGVMESALAAELERLGWTVHSSPGVPADRVDLCVVLVDGRDWDLSLLALSDTVDLAGQAIAPLTAVAGTGHRAAFVTVTRLDGALGLSGSATPEEALSGGAGGVVKTLAHEQPGLFCRALDIAPEFDVDSAVGMILTEIHDAATNVIEVGIAPSGRRTVEPGPYGTVPPVVLPSGSPELTVGAEDLFVVSGGARGVTAACVGELAERSGAKFVLLGRTELGDEAAWASGVPDDQLAQALAEATPGLNPREFRGARDLAVAQREVRGTLDALGDRAEYVSVDVTDPDAVRTVLEPYRSRVTGIVHGAGVLSDALLTDRAPGSALKVLRTKITGLRALLGALSEAPLRHVVLFTSVAGLFGNAGQADYAAANEALCRVAASLKHRWPAWHVTAIDWGAWDGGMVTPELRDVFRQRDVDLVSLAGGARAFVDQFAAGRTEDVRVLAGPASALTSFAGPAVPQSISVRRNLVGLEDTEVLQAHRIAGSPVLPATFGLGWLVNVVERSAPGLRVVGCRGFEVHKGIVFDGDHGVDYVVETGVPQATGDAWEVRATVRGRSGMPHYSGTLVLASHPSEAPRVSPVETGTGPAGGLSLYETGELFHGEVLQGIRRVVRDTDDRLVLECQLCDTPVWHGAFAGTAHSPVLTDVLLQGGCLFAARRLDEACLPLGIAEVEYFAPLPGNAPFMAIVDGLRREGAGMSVTITACDPSGSVLMRLRGVSAVAAPGLAAKFASAVNGRGEA